MKINKTEEPLNLDLIMENSRLIKRVSDLINENTALREQLEYAEEEDKEE